MGKSKGLRLESAKSLLAIFCCFKLVGTAVLGITRSHCSLAEASLDSVQSGSFNLRQGLDKPTICGLAGVDH